MGPSVSVLRSLCKKNTSFDKVADATVTSVILHGIKNVKCWKDVIFPTVWVK